MRTRKWVDENPNRARAEHLDEVRQMHLFS